MLANTRVTSPVALPRPGELTPEPHDRQTQRFLRSRAADILTISDNPTLSIYLSGLFQQSGWKIAGTLTYANGMAFLRDNRAAVAICEEELPDGCWRDAAVALGSIPDAPELIVIGENQALAQKVLALGGFDALVRPLRESDVVWTIASAWHAWMKRFDGGENGVPLCSGA